MASALSRISTGLDGFDTIIDGLRSGDNVVWQVDNVEDYRLFVKPFVEQALHDKRKVVYVRFAQHEPIVDKKDVTTMHVLNARSGFESFSTEVHTLITQEGEGAFYVFDCLSDLLSAWATDLMVGNFFVVVCPYLFQLKTVAYFALIRHSHSFRTIARIRETTQVLIDVYNTGENIYIHPLKVKGRYSPEMFLPYVKKNNQFTPLTRSADAAFLLKYISKKGVEHSRRNIDYWDRLFFRIEELLQTDEHQEEKDELLAHLCEIMIGREKRMLNLVKKHFFLEDLLFIKSRLIGTGYIGGKAAGMLLARKILSRDASFNWQPYLEPHDSFFIGSDIFYTYLVENGWWKLRMQQKTKEGYFEVARILREQMSEGTFPDEIEEQFWQVIEHFGQSPIIVRSSSLLEDAFGNAFAGKYESIFLPNQGTPDQRYKKFSESVRRIFASTMNEDALTYRRERGLDQQDEQMALLVQRVSGSYRHYFFFPDIAGVGISYNTFVWTKDMDPKAGMLRLVVGLGTHAVNRAERDYPRIVALDKPYLQPYGDIDDARKYSQHEVDVLNIKTNEFQTIPISEIVKDEIKMNLDVIAVKDYEMNEQRRIEGKQDTDIWIFTFSPFLMESTFPEIMQKMLKRLEKAYDYPVDIEFTVNFTEDSGFQINLLQCRPLQTRGNGKKIKIPVHIDSNRILFRTSGNFMGSSFVQPIQRIIYVDPERYMELSLSEKYDVARLIGKLNKLIPDRKTLSVLLMGPGRWGTTTPSLGVPVRFFEIHRMTAIVEIAYAKGGVMPELSFGTHFFQDLVESDIFYVALYPDKDPGTFNKHVYGSFTNVLTNLLPESAQYEHTVKVYDFLETPLCLMADIVSQKVLCFSPEHTDERLRYE